LLVFNYVLVTVVSDSLPPSPQLHSLGGHH